MKRSEFIEVLERLAPGTSLSVTPLGLPLAATLTAAAAWIKAQPENDDTETLRYQLGYVEEHGHFNFDDG